MVLYVEALKANVVNFMLVVRVLKGLCDQLGIDVGGYTESMESSRANLVVLDGLLAAGIAELEVPQKKG